MQFWLLSQCLKFHMRLLLGKPEAVRKCGKWMGFQCRTVPGNAIVPHFPYSSSSSKMKCLIYYLNLLLNTVSNNFVLKTKNEQTWKCHDNHWSAKLISLWIWIKQMHPIQKWKTIRSSSNRLKAVAKTTALLDLSVQNLAIKMLQCLSGGMVPYYNHNPRTEISFQDEDTHRIASIPRMPMSRQNKTQNVGTQCCLTENTFTLLPKESFLGKKQCMLLHKLWRGIMCCQ